MTRSSQTRSSQSSRGAQITWLVLLPLVWLGGYVLLARYGVLFLPRAVMQRLTLTSYLGLVQLLVMALGLYGVLVLTRRSPELRDTLLPLKFRGASIAYALLLAPPVYVVAHSLGMYLAFDTLIAELARHGARAVQQQTGEFGRSTALDSWLVVVPFTVLLAPLGEELLFRGGIYGAIQSFFLKKSQKTAQLSDRPLPQGPALDDEPSPDSLVIAGLPRRGAPLADQVKNVVFNGGAAWLISALAFGLMHADTPGGMGIVRLTTASVLGLACGLARFSSASLIPAIALHAGYNLLALGTLRAWFISDSWPSKYALPTILLPIAGCTLAAAVVLFFIEKGSTNRSTW